MRYHIRLTTTTERVHWRCEHAMLLIVVAVVFAIISKCGYNVVATTRKKAGEQRPSRSERSTNTCELFYHSHCSNNSNDCLLVTLSHGIGRDCLESGETRYWSWSGPGLGLSSPVLALVDHLVWRNWSRSQVHNSDVCRNRLQPPDIHFLKHSKTVKQSITLTAGPLQRSANRNRWHSDKTAPVSTEYIGSLNSRALCLDILLQSDLITGFRFKIAILVWNVSMTSLLPINNLKCAYWNFAFYEPLVGNSLPSALRNTLNSFFKSESELLEEK